MDSAEAARAAAGSRTEQARRLDHGKWCACNGPNGAAGQSIDPIPAQLAEAATNQNACLRHSLALIEDTIRATMHF
jgi:hypothetical protein